MGFKSELTPLRGSGLVKQDQEASLRKLGITTVEELWGSLYSALEATAELLTISEQEATELRDQAWALVPAKMREALAFSPEPGHIGGVLPPRDLD